MKMKLLASAVALGLGLWAMAGSAQTLYSFEDDDVDAVLDPETLTAKTTGDLEIGDIFVSAFEVPVLTIGGANGIPAGMELTGVAAIELTAIIDGAASGVGNQYVFGAYTGGLNAILALGGGTASVDDGDPGEGAAIAMWFNGTSGAGGDEDLLLNRTTDPATNCSSVDDCIYQASLGDLFQVDGFGLDPDEFWVATQNVPTGPGGIIDTALDTNNTTIVVSANVGLSNFFQAGGQVEFIDATAGTYCGDPGYIADGCVQLSASIPITGGQGLSNGFIAHSDFDAQKYVSVPEPSVLALLGAGLIGLGGVRRKGKKA
jgi:hypothetical protein